MSLCMHTADVIIYYYGYTIASFENQMKGFFPVAVVTLRIEQLVAVVGDLWCTVRPTAFAHLVRVNGCF